LTFEDEKLGMLRLQTGVVVADPPDSVPLQNIIKELCRGRSTDNWSD
jgi:hypothetical protein